MERVQDGDGFGQFVADRVRVAAERIQRRGLDPGGEPGAAVFEPVSVGLPGPARNEVQQPGMNHTVGVAGVVHDPGDHAGSWRAGVGPDMLIDAERVHPCQPARGCDPPGGFHPHGVPDGVPGDAELVGQGRDRGVETLQRIGRPRRRPGSSVSPADPASGCSSVNVVLGQSGSGQRQTRLAHSSRTGRPKHGNVMEPDLPAPVAHRNDAAVRAAGDILPGLDAQNQAWPRLP